MKFTVQANLFIKPLQLALASAETRSTLPILSHFLIQEAQGGLSITGCNLETELRTFAPARVESAGGMTLEAQKLVNLVKQLPGDADIAISEANGRATLKAGKSRFTLSTYPAENFPAFPVGDIKATTKIPFAVLAEKDSGAVRLEYREGELHISLSNAVDENANDAIPAEIEGELEGVSFNPNYLLDALTHLHAEKVELALSQAYNQCRLTDDSSVVHVVMPMRV